MSTGAEDTAQVEVLQALNLLDDIRNRIYARLQRILDDSAKWTPETYAYHAGALQRMRNLEVEFLAAQRSISEQNLKLLDRTARLSVNKVQERFDEIMDAINVNYFRNQKEESRKVQSEEIRRKSEQNATPSGNDSTMSTPTPSKAKLPHLALPTFDGTLATWSGFYSRFKVAIHDSQLSKVEKFQYLLSTLKGEASDVIRSLPLTEGNYDVAWELLVSRYQSERRHIFSHFGGLLDLPEMKANAYLQVLPQFLNKLMEHLHALVALKIEKESFAPMLVTVIFRKMPQNLRRRLEDSREDSTQYPKLDEIIDFLKAECSQILDNPTHLSDSVKTPKILVTQGDPKPHKRQDMTCSASPSPTPSQYLKPKHKKQPEIALQGPQTKCRWCASTQHNLFQCEEFLKLEPVERKVQVKLKNKCFNCIGDHLSSSCTSKKRCLTCNGSHNTLLHVPKASAHLVNDELSVTSSNSANTADAGLANAVSILPTAKIRITGKNGSSLVIRALCDSGASHSMMLKKCATALNLKPSPVISSVSGLAQNSVKVDGILKVDIGTIGGETLVSDHPFIVAPKLTGYLPSVPVSPKIRLEFEAYQLADNEFDVPGEIQAILASDVIPRVLTGAILKPDPAGPVGLGTAFGLVIMGQAPLVDPLPPESINVVALLQQDPLSTQLEKFWQMEQAAPRKILSPAEKAVEELYEATTVQQPNGRYKVKLPFKTEKPPLGSSMFQATKRFQALERRFEQDPEFHDAYVRYMEDYEKKGFMTPCPPPPKNKESYIIPHHGVFKKNAHKKKLRVVYDASCKTTSGYSLNDVLEIGQPLHNDMRKIVIQFRQFPIVMTADIEQMYNQIDIHEEHRPYQMIIWRKNTGLPIQYYLLNTVIFGVNSSPYLAMRTLHKLARDHGHKYPLAAEALLNSSFMDDIVLTATTTAEAEVLVQQLIELLALGGFTLKKWTSSLPSLLKNFPVEHLECPVLDETNSPRLSILGVQWLPGEDTFTYKIYISNKKGTKRNILSAIASMYDPLSWLTPVIMKAKILMQDIWRLKIDWDQTAPLEIRQRWTEFQNQLSSLPQVRIPRRLHRGKIEDHRFELHAFSDASCLGYCSCLYLRAIPRTDPPPTDNRRQTSRAEVNLIIAKSRVAPLSTVSIPRLELCASVHMIQLIETYGPQLNLSYNFEKIYCWTDSTIVWHWVQTPSYKLNTFVANRVALIESSNVDVVWRHVPSEENAADPGSRGVMPSEIPNLSLWWSGPDFLKGPEEDWPNHPLPTPKESELEIKKSCTALISSSPSPTPLPVFPILETWDATLISLAWAYRFFQRTHNKNRVIGPLMLSEVRAAETWILKSIQKEVFGNDIKALKKGSLCSKKLQKLTPFLDKNGVLRVGGRLLNSELPLRARHPALLPSKHPLVQLLVLKYHTDTLHAPPQLLQATLTQKYWIIRARDITRRCVHQCISCFRAKPRNHPPLMGNLPPARTTPSPCFDKTGVDFAGPLSTKIHLLRSARIVKVYLCIFVCFATKAVHVELVSDLTTTAFIAALHRFAARRSCPTTIYCDNGTNFVGANNVMKKYLTNDNPDIQKFERHTGITFEFNPPAAPHMGGIWEASVKSVKGHLFRTIGTTVLYYEELLTLCCRIEAMLNSRPITPLSSDPNDLEPLTPGHFLVGRPLNAPPEPEHSDVQISKLRRWDLVHAFAQSIWRRWQKEYLHTLQQRKKWNQETPNMQKGTLVLIHEDNLPPLKWKLGRVIATFPGSDGLTRVVLLKTQNGELKRPVHKVYPLPLDV